MQDERLGTQRPLILIEALDFYRRQDQAAIGNAVKAAIGLDQIEVQYVPPRFLTKTSSGKINRKASVAHWLAQRDAATRGAAAEDPLAELEAAFPTVPRDLPVADMLDSLSLTVLRIILSGAGLAHDPRRSLDAITALLRAPADPAVTGRGEAIRIVSLTDRRVVRDVSESHLARLGAAFGCPVTWEHVCLPPSAVILSDLIFHDWFQPRLDQTHFAAVDRAMAKLREASIILADDVAEMFFPPQQVYGVLSHNLERDPRADFVAVRWQRYPQHHDKLPLTVVSGADLSLKNVTASLDELAAYLGKPIFRIATIRGFQAYTKDWEYRSLRGISGAPGGIEVIDADAFTSRLISWARALPTPPARGAAAGAAAMEASDLAHFCSHMTKQPELDRIIDRFERFCIVGQPASVPYIRRRLDALGKPYVVVPSYAPDLLRTVQNPYQCLLICGSQGNFAIEGPAAAIMPATGQWTTRNIDDPAIKDSVFTTRKNEAPQSGTDWHYPFEPDRKTSAEDFAMVRRASAAANKRLRLQQARQRALRGERPARAELPSG